MPHTLETEIDEALLGTLPPPEAVEVAPEPTPEQLLEEEERKRLFDFDQARIRLQQLVNEFEPEAKETEVRRKLRDVTVNVEALRKSGALDDDETFLPQRIINTNIEREKPAFINYLKNSRRLAIFRCVDKPKLQVDLLEEQFTYGMQYIGWELPHFKCLDGSQSHGWDAVEVVYDDTKPLHVGIEHIGHDKLIFSLDARDIQQCETVIRVYEFTPMQLRRAVLDFNFVKEQVDLLLAKTQDATSKREKTITVYKKFCKYNGVVYVAWFALSDGVKDWLKPPTKLFVGRDVKQVTMQQEEVPVGYLPDGSIETTTVSTPVESFVEMDEALYPIFILPYSESEKQKISEHIGRVNLDEFKQEAQTSIATSFVNGLNRATTTLASPTNDLGNGSTTVKNLDVKLFRGKIMDKPFNFWHPNYPDPSMLSALQYFDVANSQEVGQISFAANNRQDSRKTATEIGAAAQQNSLLNSVQVTLFSIYVRSVYNYVWAIVRNRAVNGKITLLPKEDGTNDLETIDNEFIVLAAGDSDVIQRQEKIQRMKQDWPVVANTPAALVFLADLLKLQYPDDGLKYANLLQQGNPVLMVQALLGIITAPEVLKMLEATIPPEQQAQLQGIIQQASQVVTTQQPQQGQQAA